jgi:uncharacterized YigZ family protein
LEYSFQTIKKASDILFKERASKFFAFVFPIDSEDDFKRELEKIKELHPQAGHHCYAFRIGVNGEQYRYSDDGEPNNSAGKPMYGQLLSSEITNVGAVVTRYFGGTKLGVGGLVSAYKEAVKLAIENTHIITTEIKDSFLITYSYDETSSFNQLVSKFDLEIVDTTFEVQCTSIVKCTVPQKIQLIKYCEEYQISLKEIDN